MVIPRGTKAPKLWPAEPVKVSEMVSSGSPGRPVAPADLRSQQGPDGAVDVRDGQEPPRPACHRPPQAAHASSELMIQCLLEPVVLQPRLVARHVVGHVGLGQHRAEIEPGGLPVGDRHFGVEQVDPSDRFLQGAQSRGQPAARGPPRRCTRRRSRRTRVCPRTWLGATCSGWRCRRGTCRGGRRAS